MRYALRLRADRLSTRSRVVANGHQYEEWRWWVTTRDGPEVGVVRRIARVVSKPSAPNSESLPLVVPEVNSKIRMRLPTADGLHEKLPLPTIPAAGNRH
jgi:hypothetical protein